MSTQVYEKYKGRKVNTKKKQVYIHKKKKNVSKQVKNLSPKSANSLIYISIFKYYI